MESYKEGTRTPLQTDRRIFFLGDSPFVWGKVYLFTKEIRHRHQHLLIQPVNARNNEHSHCSLLAGVGPGFRFLGVSIFSIGIAFLLGLMPLRPEEVPRRSKHGTLQNVTRSYRLMRYNLLIMG